MNKIPVLIAVIMMYVVNLFSADNQIIWNIDNLTAIGGNTVVVYGAPSRVLTDKGYALEFNSAAVTAPTTGNGNRIQIKANPLGTSGSEFTIEMIFKPYATSSDFAPRVLHICTPDSASNAARVMTMEIRSTNTWSTDYYIKSVTGSGVLGTKTYPTGQWMHMAMTYKNGVVNGYVNGILDVSYTGNTYTGLPSTAEVSLGGRMNNVNYFKGLIFKLIFTPVALIPSQFTLTDVTAIDKEQIKRPFELIENFPNPVEDATTFRYYLPAQQYLKLELFNSNGQKISILDAGVKPEGGQELVWNRGNLPAGIYFYTITTQQGWKQTRQLILI